MRPTVAAAAAKPRQEALVVTHKSMGFRPGGSFDNSPAIHRWVRNREIRLFVPEGRLKPCLGMPRSSVPTGRKSPRLSISPAVNCWATTKRPSGTNNHLRLVCNNEGNALRKLAQSNRYCRPNGPIFRRAVGPLGRQMGNLDFATQGDALGWANGWAFGPHNRCQEILLRPSPNRLAPRPLAAAKQLPSYYRTPHAPREVGRHNLTRSVRSTLPAFRLPP